VARIRLVHQTIIALVRTSHFFTDIVFAKLRWRVYTHNIPTFYRQTQPQYAFRLIVFFTVIVSVYLSVYWYLGDGDTDRREILHDGRYRSRKESIPRCPQGAPKSQILTANISKTVSRSVTYQIGHNTGSTRANFQRCITWDSSAIWSPLWKKYVVFASGTRWSYTRNGRPIVSRLWSIERPHVQQPWTTLAPNFKVTPLFDAEYLRETARDIDMVSMKY